MVPAKMLPMVRLASLVIVIALTTNIESAPSQDVEARAELKSLDPLIERLNKNDQCEMPSIAVLDNAFDVMAGFVKKYQMDEIFGRWDNYKILYDQVLAKWPEVKKKILNADFGRTVANRMMMQLVSSYQNTRMGHSVCADLAVAPPIEDLPQERIGGAKSVDSALKGLLVPLDYE